MSIRLRNHSLVTDPAPYQLVTAWAEHKAQGSHEGSFSRAGKCSPTEAEGQRSAGEEALPARAWDLRQVCSCSAAGFTKAAKRPAT